MSAVRRDARRASEGATYSPIAASCHTGGGGDIFPARPAKLGWGAEGAANRRPLTEPPGRASDTRYSCNANVHEASGKTSSENTRARFCLGAGQSSRCVSLALLDVPLVGGARVSCHCVGFQKRKVPAEKVIGTPGEPRSFTIRLAQGRHMSLLEPRLSQESCGGETVAFSLRAGGGGRWGIFGVGPHGPCWGGTPTRPRAGRSAPRHPAAPCAGRCRPRRGVLISSVHPETHPKAIRVFAMKTRKPGNTSTCPVCHTTKHYSSGLAPAEKESRLPRGGGWPSGPKAAAL